MEKKSVHAADVVVLNTKRMQDEYVEIYGEDVAPKLRSVTNGFDPEYFEKFTNLKPTNSTNPTKPNYSPR